MSLVCYLIWTTVIGLIVWFVRFLYQLECDVHLSLREKYGVSLDTLNGKVIWVTGASTGIGQQIVLQLAKLKCKIVISARNEQQLIDLKKDCLKLNPHLKSKDILVLKLDVTAFDSHELALQTILKQFGQVDVLVNNAGVGQAGPFEQIDLELDRKVFETNVFGPVNLSRVMCSHWIRTEHAGHLVLNSSTSALVHNPWSSSYCASKAAVSAYMMCLEKEYMHTKNAIRSTIVYPGPIETDIFNRSYRWKVGQTYSRNFVDESNKTGVFSWVKADRCAELFVVAIANQVRSCWISKQPVLGFTFCAYYFPDLIPYLWSICLKFSKKSLENLYLS